MISSSGKHYNFPYSYENDVFEELKKSIEIKNINIEELIHVDQLTILDETTYIMIESLNLFYLLFNNEQILITSTIPSMIDVDNIRQIVNKTDKLNAILKFINYSPHYKLSQEMLIYANSSKLLEEICNNNYIDILSWLYLNKYYNILRVDKY